MPRTLRAPGLRARVDIHRGESGTPTVCASSLNDALFGLGFVHGRDRPLQIALQLNAVDGTLSSRIANIAPLRQLDRQILRLGVGARSRAQVSLLSPFARDAIAAYGAGLRCALASRGPVMRALLRRSVPDYAPHHAIGLLLLMGYAGLTDGQRAIERFTVEALQRGVSRRGLAEIFGAALDGIDEELLRGVRLQGSVVHDPRPGLDAIARAAGSNNWVVAPRRSADGRALLASDPHLEVNRLPQVVYEVQLVHGAGQWMHGASLPGLPGLAIGRNARLAWGATYGTPDACDYFVERCDGRGNVLRDGTWTPLDHRRERVGGRELTIWESVHGPLEGPAGTEAGDYLAWSWAAWDRAAQSVDGFLRLCIASSIDDAREALSAVAVPALNVVLADATGDVGYQYVGAIPVRRAGWSGLYPVPGRDPANDWTGTVPFDQLPAQRSAGFVDGVYATANNRPDRVGGAAISTVAQAPYRWQRICELLAGDRALDVADLQRIQYDVVSLQARRLVPLVLDHLPAGPARDSLRRWDFRYDARSTAPTLFENIYEELVREVFCGGPAGEWMHAALTRTSIGVILFGQLDDVIMSDASTWLPAERRREVIARACQRGAEREAEPWGKRHALQLRHVVLGGPLGRALRLDRGPLPWDGGRATVRQASMFEEGGRPTTFAAVYHFVTSLGADTSWTNMPAGAREAPWSQWYTSGLSHWLSGTYRRLTPALRGSLEVTLQPA